MRKIKYFLCLLLCIGLYLFCERQTEGFRYYQLLSDVPNDPRWDMPPLAQEEQNAVDQLLNQKFTFLSHGGVCHAFLGEDKKTVIKFYIHNHLSPSSLFKNFSWEKLFLKSAQRTAKTSAYEEFYLKSCKLLFTQAKDRTGLIYIHLNKQQEPARYVQLVDNIGITHRIDISKTEFVLQQRADLLTDYIKGAIKEKDMERAKKAIDGYFNCLSDLCKRGIKDLDHSFKKNYGICSDGTVISIDISSFIEEPSLKRPGSLRKEIIFRSHNLGKLLKKCPRDLWTYYDDKLTEFLE